MQEMQEVRLKKLSLRNFQGIKDFTLDAQTEDISVYGDNSTGKTTLANSFHYLLFGKNLEGRADFEVKTLDEQGQALHNLEHSVTAVFDMGGKELTLSRTLKEKWVKKRGSAAQTFSGHETDFKVNLVPVKKSEYEAAINSIIDEDTFRLLTNPAHFNALHWEKRRAILLTVCGDITDADVIASNAALSKLPEILSDYTLDDYRKILAEKRKKINQEIQMLPIRISEVSQGLPTIDDIKDAGELDKDLELLREQQGEKRNELTQVNAGGAVAVKTKTLREIEGELIGVENEHRKANDGLIQGKRDEANKLMVERSDITTRYQMKEKEVEGNNGRIKYLETLSVNLRENWHHTNSEVFEGATCPTCGQELPEQQVAEATATFNRNKAETLASISANGKEHKAEIDELTAANERLAAEIVELKSKSVTLVESVAALKCEDIDLPDISCNEAYQAKLAEKTAIEAEIETLKLGNGEAIKTIEHEIFGLQQSIDTLGGTKARLEQHTKGTERIAELEKQEKLLAKEYERLSKELFDAEEALRQKVAQLDEAISSKFKLVRFNLFKEQINEGIKETCDTTLNGVPYESANSAGRTQAGCDIITTMQQHYQVSAPIFIDNRESCLWIPEMNCQVISLIVSSADKSLRVETKASAVA